jgi:hypothetical protein
MRGLAYIKKFNFCDLYYTLFFRIASTEVPSICASYLRTSIPYFVMDTGNHHR